MATYRSSGAGPNLWNYAIVYFIGIVICLVISLILTATSTISPDDTRTILGAVSTGLITLFAIVISYITFLAQKVTSDISHFEDRTLDYVLRLSGYTYPSWDETFEADIANGSISKRYGESGRGKPLDETTRQQKRLENLKIEHNTLLQNNRALTIFSYQAELSVVLPLILALSGLLVSSFLKSISVSTFLDSFSILLTAMGLAAIVSLSLPTLQGLLSYGSYKERLVAMNESMSGSADKDKSEQLKLVTEMQRTEADLHWKRNSHFLLVSSILLVALSQFQSQFALQFLIGFLGFMMNIAWLLIQYRSSKYIEYWKAESRKLSVATNAPDIYPKSLKGIEMRKVAFTLPIPFLIVWAVVMGLAILRWLAVIKP